MARPQFSNARNFRSCNTAMFEWAAEAGRKWVKMNPCHYLPALDKEIGRQRVLSAAESGRSGEASITPPSRARARSRCR